MPMPGKLLSRPALGGVRVWREATNEVHDPVAPPAAGLVPQPVGQQTGSDSLAERGDEAQFPGGCERPGRKQKQGSRYWQTYLVREYRSKQDGVAMLQEKLDDSFHSEITTWATFAAVAVREALSSSAPSFHLRFRARGR
jgi:hypothetical protein